MVKSPLGVAYSVATLTVATDADSVVIATKDGDVDVPYEHIQGNNGKSYKMFSLCWLLFTV